MPMKIRFRLITRGERGKQFYCVDTETGKRFSLKTKDRDAAKQIVLAKNQALRQPNLNLHIAESAISNLELMTFGGLIIFFLIVEPHGLARMWQIAKEKLRLWPFPH